MYPADFDFDCKSHFGGFCGWSAVLKFKSFHGGKTLHRNKLTDKMFEMLHDVEGE